MFAVAAFSQRATDDDTPSIMTETQIRCQSERFPPRVLLLRHVLAVAAPKNGARVPACCVRDNWLFGGARRVASVPCNIARAEDSNPGCRGRVGPGRRRSRSTFR